MNNNLLFLSNEFTLFLSREVTDLIKKNEFCFSKFQRIAMQRRDFFVANEIADRFFCQGLYKKIQYEMHFIEYDDIKSSLIYFKKKFENGNCQGFPKNRTTEDMLRSTLMIYLNEECFAEPRVGTGRCDILIPAKKTIIETKLWKGVEYYNSGFPEVNEYINKSSYNQGYYIVFDYNKKPNNIILELGEVFDSNFSKNKICVLFIRMNSELPSKIYQNDSMAKK